MWVIVNHSFPFPGSIAVKEALSVLQEDDQTTQKIAATINTLVKVAVALYRVGPIMAPGWGLHRVMQDFVRCFHMGLL
jgi:hypothetical protein